MRGARGQRSAPGLRLYGVVSLAAPGRLAVDGAAASARARLQTPPLGTPAAEVVRVRDLGAVVAEARWAAEPLTAELVRGHRLVVEAVFAERAVLPAPPGALFRSRAALSAWMELHAASLAEGLRFVEDRAEARVTARSDAGAPPDDAAASDEVARAAELFTALRREAVAHLVLRADADGGAGVPELTPAAGARAVPPTVTAAALAAGAHAAFLVDRSRWAAFADAVAREARRHPGLHLACGGPWPPYSFVRLDFAG